MAERVEDNFTEGLNPTKHSLKSSGPVVALSLPFHGLPEPFGFYSARVGVIAHRNSFIFAGSCWIPGSYTPWNGNVSQVHVLSFVAV